MSTKELIAEIKTIQKLESAANIKAICDVLIVKAMDEKQPIGFKGRNDE